MHTEGYLKNEETTKKDKVSGNPLRTLDEIKFGYNLNAAPSVYRHAKLREEMDWFESEEQAPEDPGLGWLCSPIESAYQATRQRMLRWYGILCSHLSCSSAHYRISTRLLIIKNNCVVMPDIPRVSLSRCALHASERNEPRHLGNSRVRSLSAAHLTPVAPSTQLQYGDRVSIS